VVGQPSRECDACRPNAHNHHNGGSAHRALYGQGCCGPMFGHHVRGSDRLYGAGRNIWARASLVINPAYKSVSINVVVCARTNGFATEEARQLSPRAVRIPRWFSARDIASSVCAPVCQVATTTGSRPETNASAAATCVARPSAPACVRSVGFPSLAPLARLEANAPWCARRSGCAPFRLEQRRGAA